MEMSFGENEDEWIMIDEHEFNTREHKSTDDQVSPPQEELQPLRNDEDLESGKPTPSLALADSLLLNSVFENSLPVSLPEEGATDKTEDGPSVIVKTETSETEETPSIEITEASFDSSVQHEIISTWSHDETTRDKPIEAEESFHVERFEQKSVSLPISNNNESMSFSLTSQEELDGRIRIGQSRILFPERSKETLTVDEVGTLSIHEVEPEEVMSNEDLMLRKCRITVESGIPKAEKVIILLGATGAGKTSLMHSMMNYIFGVSWENRERIRLQTARCDNINERHASARSQTRWITSYLVEHQPGFQVPYSVNIIDTPGLGDTEGIARDIDICKQLKHFLETDAPFGLDHIDAICYVVKSSENRLGTSMSYSINEILKLFSKEVREIFYLFTTFHDGNRPCALDAVAAANMTYQTTFPINNAAFFMPPSSNFSDIQRGHFHVAQQSLKEFFDLLTNRIEPPCSLTLTREVLKERQRLQLTLEGIATQIQMRVEEIKESNQEQQMILKYQEEIANNENFTFTVEQTHFELIPIEGRNVTNCTKCQFTCCEGCKIYYDKLKWFCAAMDLSGKCKKCPGKCRWSDHHNPSAKFVPRTEVVTRTYEDMKRKYDLAMQGKRGKEDLLQRMQSRLETIEQEVIQMIHTARESLTLLNDIALRGNSLNAAEYIDMLIADERSQLTDGWQERVEQLTRLKEKTQLKHLLPDTVVSDRVESLAARESLITPSFVQDCSNQLALF